MLKLRDALRDDVAAGRRRFHRQSSSPSASTTAYDVDVAARLASTTNRRDYFCPQRG